ncbi:MAG: hypothetical protein WCJ35_02535 [Planctomycetota bacterium]
MKTWNIAACISCYLILTTGCNVCRHPYTNCGPVWSRGACLNCNPDYRAGSVLNRDGPGGLVANIPRAAKPVPRDTQPVPRAAPSARVAAHRSDGPTPQVRAKTVAQPRQTPKRALAERQTTQAPPKSTVMPEAPAPNDLPLGTVAAPQGTKEGETRILSVTDRRLDELQESPKPVAAKGKSPQRTVEKPREDLGGWRPAAPHQDP